jgi:hypothetical protein
VRRFGVELAVFAYVLLWIPYIALTRVVSSEPHGGMAHPLTGLQILPLTLIVATFAMWAFLWAFGWLKAAHHVRLGDISIPVPTKLTAVGGIGAGLILATVPLSLTFPGVSIPFIQLLMRGDALIVAPLVDWLAGRKVHWYSIVALIMVAMAMAFTISMRGGLHIPFLCLVVIVLNMLGYFLRLMIMTRLAKNPDPESRKRYFSEEQLVAYPLVLSILGVLALVGGVKPLLDIRWGFMDLWSQSIAWVVLPLGVGVMLAGVVAAYILLNKRENTYCVPLERSASVIGGVIAAYVLYRMKGYPAPTAAEMIGVGVLICAIVVLSVGPELGKKKRTILVSAPLPDDVPAS